MITFCVACDIAILNKFLCVPFKTCFPACRQRFYRVNKLAAGFVIYRGYFYSASDLQVAK